MKQKKKLRLVTVAIPEGKSGIWEVRKLTVTERDEVIERLRAAFNGKHRWVPEGTYTALLRDNHTIMSDTPDEISDHLVFAEKAKGQVLINGLGLGVALELILQKKEVQYVTVIEKSEDVIRLVKPTYKSEMRVNIIHADAFTWEPHPSAMYDVVWNDIWDNISMDNLIEMGRLRKKYSGRAKWIGNWAEQECRTMLCEYESLLKLGHRLNRDVKDFEKILEIILKEYDPNASL